MLLYEIIRDGRAFITHGKGTVSQDTEMRGQFISAFRRDRSTKPGLQELL